MEWRDEGLVIGVRRYGETSVIVELMTKSHGRHLGMVRGGLGRALRSVLQPGNRVEANWRARLENHMGAYKVEPLKSRAAKLIESDYALHGVAYLGALLRLLPERDPQADLFEMAEVIADRLDSLTEAPALLARFELELLAALGFGLDLSACALTGTRDDLAYVSPKSGRAVSRDAGAPWRDRLLRYPLFLREGTLTQDAGELAAAFALTGHFLARDVFTPRNMPPPPARSRYIEAACRANPKRASA